MRPELQAKLLQHLNKKKADKGFTLVELLVVIVIIGILTAIALPSFLNQTAKAKQSEAKQNISAVIKAEQAFRTENPSFTTNFDDLALGTLSGTGPVQTTTFVYTLAAPTNVATEVNMTADSRDAAVLAFSGRTETGTVAGAAGNQIAWTSVICEAQAPNNTASATTPYTIGAPTSTVVGTPGTNTRIDCVGTSAPSYIIR
jgi:type IV pilus assembly protein PilA